MTNLYTNNAKLIRANAGAGKTFALTNQYISLLLKGESADHILAITFTKKAAGEIFSRILKRLANAVLNENEKEKLLNEIGIEKKDIKLSVDECLSKFLLIQQRNLVATMDSFFTKIAGSFSLDLGLGSKFAISDENRKDEIYSDTIKELCSVLEPSKLLSLINEYYEGTGKNTIDASLKSKLAQFYDIFVSANQEAWFFFEEKMQDEKQRENIISKFENFLETTEIKNKKLLKLVEKDLNYLKDNNYEEMVSSAIISQLDKEEITYYSKEVPVEIISIYRELLPLVKNEIVIKLNKKTKAIYELLKKFSLIYENLRNKKSVIGFDDLKYILKEVLVIQNLQDIYYRLDTRVRHVLLDEFQDTSLVQWELIYPIVEEILSGGTEDRSFFCVGDPKQAIYGWRGGVSEIFEKITKLWENVKEENLVRTYRSTPEVVDFVNFVFKNLSSSDIVDDFKVALDWEKNFPMHEVADSLKNKKGYVRVKGFTPRIDENDEKDSIYDEIARQVKNFYDENLGLEIGVLCRKNDEVSNVITVLKSEKYNLPVSQEGGSYLIDSSAVVYVLAVFKIMAHPNDSVAKYKILSLKEDFFNDGEETNNKLYECLENEGFLGLTLKLIEGIKDKISKEDYFKLSMLEDFCSEYDASDSDKDIDNFIQEVRTLKKENPTSSLIRVMTVHSAKGLEFDVTIVPQFLNKGGGNESPLSQYFEDRVSAPKKIFAPIKKDYAVLDKVIKEVSEQNENFKMKEALCCLYVALTRAKRASVVILEKKETKEESKAKVFSRYLYQLMGSEFVTNNSLREFGNREDFINDVRKDFESKKINIEKKNKKIKKLYLSGFKAKELEKNLNIKSPSGEEGKKIYSIKEKFNLNLSHTLNRGTLLHAFYENIDWIVVKNEKPVSFFNNKKEYQFKKNEFITDNLKNENKFVFNEEELLDLYQKFENSFLSKEICEKFEENYFNEKLKLQDIQILKEEPFMFRDEEKNIYKGFIDRVIVGKNDKDETLIYIYDFKSDVVEIEKLNDRAMYYKPQIDIYKKAMLKRYGNNTKINTSLLFVLMGKEYQFGNN